MQFVEWGDHTFQVGFVLSDDLAFLEVGGGFGEFHFFPTHVVLTVDFELDPGWLEGELPIGKAEGNVIFGVVVHVVERDRISLNAPDLNELIGGGIYDAKFVRLLMGLQPRKDAQIKRASRLLTNGCSQ